MPRVGLVHITLHTCVNNTRSAKGTRGHAFWVQHVIVVPASNMLLLLLLLLTAAPAVHMIPVCTGAASYVFHVLGLRK